MPMPMMRGGGPVMMMPHHGMPHPLLLHALAMRERDDDSRVSSRSSSRHTHRDVSSMSTMTLYHQTSREIANKILSSGTMLRGSSGLAGGGIYFACSASDTERKAKQHGVILECTVAVGSIKTVGSSPPDFTFSGLRSEGYDSVKITGRASGVEYVVYNSDQVLSIRELIREYR